MLLLLESAFDVEHTRARTAAWDDTSFPCKQRETDPDGYRYDRARETIQHPPKRD